jgi:hypothetical protein
VTVLAGCQGQPLATAVAGLSTRDVASDFLKLAFADGDVRGAYERYASRDFRQHDPHIADGLAGLTAYLAESQAAPPVQNPGTIDSFDSPRTRVDAGQVTVTQ